MDLPYKPDSAVIKPTAIRHCHNGQLPNNVLEACDIRRFVLEREAARSMRALIRKARREKIPLSATGTYRTYAGQVKLFYQRYDNTPRKTRHEFWNGKNWWLKLNRNGKPVAGAAVPGTSNHGWGLAIDFSERRMGFERPLSARTLKWLASNGPKFGWWNTVKSENWHWCWCLGDGPMPIAVLEEEGHHPNPVAPAEMPVLRWGMAGEDVKTLQMKLNRVGANLLVDGKFGPRTDQAVRAFQEARKLIPNGVVGPETWAAFR
jgi:hypothetical protein